MYRKRLFAIFLFLLSLNTVYCLIFNFPFEFGVEGGNVAKNIAEGNGFSNPFGAITGPSAWVAPFLPYLLAFFMKLFGVSFTAFAIMTVIKMLSFAASLILIIKSMEFSGIKVNFPGILFLYVLYLLMFPNVNFKHIEDLWLNVLVISIFLYSLNFYSHFNSTKYLTILFIITSVTVLLNPIIAFTMIVVLAIFLFKSYLIKSVSFSHSKNLIASISYFLKSRFALRFFRDIMIITISCLLTLSIWSYRNYRTFGKFIPVKSNFWFEFYMSNVIDNDGILSWSTLCKFHPTAGFHLDSLSKMGEIKWMETWEDSSKLFIQQNPRNYLNNIFNRFVNSFLYTETVKDYHEIKIYDNIPENDRLILTKAQLVSDNMWIDLEMDNYKAETRFNGLNLSEKIAVFNDWQEAKRTLIQRRYSLPYIVKSLMMSVIPALSFLFLLFFKRIRKLCLYQVAVSFYILYLIPYIISSHDTRYQKTLFIIQVLIVYIAYIEIYNHLRKKYPRLFPAFLTGIKTKE